MTKKRTAPVDDATGKPYYPRMESRSVEDLLGAKYPGNPHKATPEAMALLNDQIEALGNVQPLTFNDRTGRILSGNKRIELYAKRGDEMTDVWVVDLPEDKERIAVIALNNHAGEFDAENLRVLTEAIAAADADSLALTGFRPGELERIIASMDDSTSQGQSNRSQQAHKTLASEFIVPPFSVLDGRQGYWLERKAAWIACGMRGEEGRGENLLGLSPQALTPTWTGTSIFDPVLCEAVYHWFCPKNGSILDPFAGGVVRGAVAACTGHPYVGIDLSEKQVEANRKQWPEIKSPAMTENQEPPVPQWICGDARSLISHVKEEEFDLIFSCPPYAFLEKYSDDPLDLSTLDLTEFMDAYLQIIESAIASLKDNRFAAFLVGEVRDPKTGFYINLVSETIDCFQSAGAQFYNEIILVTAAGTLPMRTRRNFATARKVGKTHQNLLVFFKGDPAAIKDHFPAMEPPMTMPEAADPMSEVEAAADVTTI